MLYVINGNLMILLSNYTLCDQINLQYMALWMSFENWNHNMKIQLVEYEFKLIGGIAGNGRNKKPEFRHTLREAAQ